MIDWLLEFQGKSTPLSEIDSECLRRKVAAPKKYIQERLEPILNDLLELQVVFLFDSEWGFKIFLRGAPEDVKLANSCMELPFDSQVIAKH